MCGRFQYASYLTDEETNQGHRKWERGDKNLHLGAPESPPQPNCALMLLYTILPHHFSPCIVPWSPHPTFTIAFLKTDSLCTCSAFLSSLSSHTQVLAPRGQRLCLLCLPLAVSLAWFLPECLWATVTYRTVPPHIIGNDEIFTELKNESCGYLLAPQNWQLFRNDPALVLLVEGISNTV